MSDDAIGIFDSGMGGLTVMRALMARLPNERFIYLGDTARLPYGTKSADTVTRYARAGGRRAGAGAKVKMLVIACNTASASRCRAARGVRAVAGDRRDRAGRGSRAGGSAGRSHRGDRDRRHGEGRRLCARDPCAWPLDVPVTQQACPLFVSLAEEGLVEGEIAEARRAAAISIRVLARCRSRKRWCSAARIFRR